MGERDLPVPGRSPYDQRRRVPRWGSESHQRTREGGNHGYCVCWIDLAKNVFAVHGVEEHGKPVLVRLMAPKFVAPCRLSGQRGKNDAADAAAMGEAVQRPNMWFVPIKSVDQQTRLTLHRNCSKIPDRFLNTGYYAHVIPYAPVQRRRVSAVRFNRLLGRRAHLALNQRRDSSVPQCFSISPAPVSSN